ncbi:MAG TPA: sigma-70 family RNA polymerase sigma factor [Gemmataceae bacterium]|jgi:RNA polymerase sigma-70 factor (ECF subfamily)|nr:sigma-70 family RNA polymerase sigma factor [Gemmataceae bacterium]
MAASPRSTQVRQWLERMGAGDLAARDELIRHVCGRLERLTRQMLKSYPGVQRWAQTDDVLQGAMMRLLRALREVKPTIMREFFGLAAQQVRRELLDLARHFYGPLGAGAHHASQAGRSGSGPPAYEQEDVSREPSSLAEWCEFHHQVEQLPEEEREVVGLLFYQGLPQAEAAALLNVTVRTVQRRWQSALLQLHKILKDQWPGS